MVEISVLSKLHHRLTRNTYLFNEPTRFYFVVCGLQRRLHASFALRIQRQAHKIYGHYRWKLKNWSSIHSLCKSKCFPHSTFFRYLKSERLLAEVATPYGLQKKIIVYEVCNNAVVRLNLLPNVRNLCTAARNFARSSIWWPPCARIVLRWAQSAWHKCSFVSVCLLICVTRVDCNKLPPVDVTGKHILFS